MSKFSSKQAKPRTRLPITTLGASGQTYEGGNAFALDEKSELFLLAVTNMVGEDTFYEAAGERDQRFRALIYQVANEDPDWVAGFVPFLRNEMNMRSASIVMAAEYVASGAPNGRRVVDSACSRPDEPAEILAYWVQQHGRSLPQPLKRGVADAAVRLYNEKSALKYDGVSRAWRMGDVIEMTHPKPLHHWQSDLFRRLLDRRHGHESAVFPETLEVMHRNALLNAHPVERRREIIKSPDIAEILSDAGMTWEALSGWIQGPLTAEVWEAIIPSMGYMALLRNLRNFEEAGISESVKDEICATLADPERVAKSRQFPFRFLSAYKANANSLTWAKALERALDYSTLNVPVFDGGTLVLVDTSGSMRGTLSERSTVQRWEVAAVFGGAIGKKSDCDVVSYGDSWTNLGMKRGDSVLRVSETIGRHLGRDGHSTRTWDTIAATFDPSKHKRVIIVTDMQSHPSRGDSYGRQHTDPSTVQQRVAQTANVYAFDVGGYGKSDMDLSTPGFYQVGGFSDAAFKMISLIESGKSANWPWLQH